MLTLTPKVKRTLASIIRQAEALRPASDVEDEQMYYLIGGIIANAEDALGALEAAHERGKLDRALNALRSGSVSFSGVRLG